MPHPGFVSGWVRQTPLLLVDGDARSVFCLWVGMLLLKQCFVCGQVCKSSVLLVGGHVKSVFC